jgi:hypothetical protein
LGGGARLKSRANRRSRRGDHHRVGATGSRIRAGHSVELVSNPVATAVAHLDGEQVFYIVHNIVFCLA